MKMVKNAYGKLQLALSKKENLILETLSAEFYKNRMGSVFDYMLFIRYRFGKFYMYTRNPGKLMGHFSNNIKLIEKTLFDDFKIESKNVRIVLIDSMTKFICPEQSERRRLVVVPVYKKTPAVDCTADAQN